MFPEEDAADFGYVGREIGCHVDEVIIGEGFSLELEFIEKMKGSEIGGGSTVMGKGKSSRGRRHLSLNKAAEGRVQGLRALIMSRILQSLPL